MTELTLPSCPWSGLLQSPSTFCEASLCAWIRQPANTWSNLGFVIVGILILNRSKSGTASHFSGLGWVAIVTGIGSAFYHASESRLGGIADYFGMYLGSAYMLTTNLHRLTGWRSSIRTAIFWSVVFFTLGAMISNEALARTIYGSVTLVCCLGLETLLYLKNRRTANAADYRWFWVVWLLFTASYIAWKLDESKVMCNPRNHWMNGHALWHILNAVGLYALFLYYRQFKRLCD